MHVLWLVALARDFNARPKAPHPLGRCAIQHGVIGRRKPDEMLKFSNDRSRRHRLVPSLLRALGAANSINYVKLGMPNCRHAPCNRRTPPTARNTRESVYGGDREQRATASASASTNRNDGHLLEFVGFEAEERLCPPGLKTKYFHYCWKTRCRSRWAFSNALA